MKPGTMQAFGCLTSELLSTNRLQLLETESRHLLGCLNRSEAVLTVSETQAPVTGSQNLLIKTFSN